MPIQQVHVNEHLGIVTSGTSTTQFSFFLTPLEDRITVRKNDYIITDHPVLGEKSPVLAEVTEINNHEKAIGSTFTEKAIEMVATCDIIGTVDLRQPKTKILETLLSPPEVGTKVYLPYYEFLEDTFTRDQKGKQYQNPLHIGTMQTFASTKNGDKQNPHFYINDHDFLQQHFLVSGQTGTGKTHTATILVEELANKTTMPLVILDSHGEYSTVGFKGKDSPKKYLFDFKLSIYASKPKKVHNTLKSAEVKLEPKNRLSIKSIPDQWTDSDKKNIEYVGKKLEESIRSNRITILDAEGLSLEEKREFFTVCIQSLMKSRIKERGKPLLLIVEEAKTVDNEAMQRIASEGRKLGISLCLLTQNPSELNGRVLSQMGTQILGRTTNPEDLECLKKMALEKVLDLPKLATGEWIINGITLRRPTKLIVRDRYSAKNQHP